jgi:CBS domain-containing protein
VIFDPAAPARDAARAIESNHIGAVIIQEHGRVVGIVTDRDLTTRVVGAGLDPKVTTLDRS